MHEVLINEVMGTPGDVHFEINISVRQRQRDNTPRAQSAMRLDSRRSVLIPFPSSFFNNNVRREAGPGMASPVPLL
ncbi:hypothetical protein [Massilia sp. S19_KUP03_FR1]|uniref:hypothetical protein n=1 Tax=Massilia sp. S19_KUP03_FR1 TaxID=3025503 RepID=UPI002FCD6853